jgi:hypothetical protein
LPLRRPRCCFLYFTFFGINIVFFSLPVSFALQNPADLKLGHYTPKSKTF